MNPKLRLSIGSEFKSRLIPTAAVALAYLLLAAVAFPQADGAPVEIERSLAALESSEATERSQALDDLVAVGARAALAGLSEPDRAGLDARRARAWLLARSGEADCIPGAIEWLGGSEPDAGVRRILMEFLVRADLGDAAGADRAEILAEIARVDADPGLVTYAVECLASLRHPSAGKALDLLVEELPVGPRGAAADALVNTAYGRSALLRRVRSLGTRSRAFPGDVLAILITNYGRALADDPTVGEVLADFTPFVVLAKHGDERVRLGAQIGLQNLVTRVAQSLEVERCSTIYDALERAGWDARELDYRRALLAMRFTEDPSQALDASQRIREWAEARSDREALRFRFFGFYLEAAALAASGRADLAGPHLDGAASVLTALRRTRVDLLSPDSQGSKLRGQEAVDYARQIALVELMRAVTLLLSGKAEDDLLVLETLRVAHLRLLDAQLEATRLGVDYRCDLDAILHHDLGPMRLLYDNQINPKLSRNSSISLMRSIGRGFATVAHNEMPGFSQLSPELTDGFDEAQQGHLTSPLLDPVRFDLLYNYQFAQLNRWRDEIGLETATELSRRRLTIQFQMKDEDLRGAREKLEAGESRDEAYGFMARERAPSDLALRLAQDLRAEGRAVEARDLAEQMLSDLRESGWSNGSFESEIGQVIAASYTEENRAEKAEELLLDVLSELEATVRQLKKDRETSRERGDGELVSRYDLWIQGAELRLADCLVSLAVNANVRLGDRTKALAFFERAFELNQSDFMRALLACYRARSGRTEEARVQLREISPVPALYYNMACTYALMGEAELAMDFLQRDFEENHQSQGALERQKQWAGDDPDLSSLDDLPRFQALIQPSTK
ncbi:MAG: tetratricopeptide (TPR) repeat protein [Planctomycetota bacterium]|jgi:tetratricopeptide (TPR) repeat protein